MGPARMDLSVAAVWKLPRSVTGHGKESEKVKVNSP